MPTEHVLHPVQLDIFLHQQEAYPIVDLPEREPLCRYIWVVDWSISIEVTLIICPFRPEYLDEPTVEVF